MEKRKLTSLRRVLLKYMLLCGSGCLLIVLVWWCVFQQLINTGFILPAYTAERACRTAADYAATATAETFDPDKIDSICRYAVMRAGTEEILQTNMTPRQLQTALNSLHNTGGTTVQYQYVAVMADGAQCILQYDYAVPYADPALREKLPDFQTMYFLLLAVLVIVWLTVLTRRTEKLLAEETRRMAKATEEIAAQHPERIEVCGAKVREFAAALQAMQNMGSQLTNSLQNQWKLEQQKAEQTAALAHDLKTPLAVITGNADLLAEDDNLTPEQQAKIAAMQRAADKAAQYLQTLRDINTDETALHNAMQRVPAEKLLMQCAEDARLLCSEKKIQFVLENETEKSCMIPAQEQALERALDNILENAVRFTPAGGTVMLQAVRENQYVVFTVTDTGPGFSPEALQKAGQELFTTDTARSQHWGFGLAAASRTAQRHGGSLTAANLPCGGAKVELRVMAAAKAIE